MLFDVIIHDVDVRLYVATNALLCARVAINENMKIYRNCLHLMYYEHSEYNITFFK